MSAALCLSLAAAASIRVEPRVEPFVDLWFAVRELSARPESEAPEALRPAVAAARALDAQIGSPLAWGPVDGLLPGCASAADLAARLERVPEKLEFGAGRSVELRAGVRTLAGALAAAEEPFRASLWPARERRIRAALEDLQAGFLAHQEACFAQHARALGAEGLELTVPVFLVERAPAPGAITHRAAGGKGACFVAVDGLQGSALAEVVLHEATHAIDVARDGDVFDQLRERLAKAGFGPRDRATRDAPHTLMFLQSAETIRRCLAPEHKDRGEESGYYAKVGDVAAVERAAWREHLDGKLALDAALDRIVAALPPPAPR